MTRDEMIKHLAIRVDRWHQGERSGRTSTGVLINDLLAALRAHAVTGEAAITLDETRDRFKGCRRETLLMVLNDYECAAKRRLEYSENIPAAPPVTEKAINRG